jgi:hypothetical protein
MKVFAKIIPILALAIPAAGVPIPGSARQKVSVSGPRSGGSRDRRHRKGNMHLRGKAALAGRPSAGWQLAVVMAAAGLVAGLTLTSGVASAAEAAATSPGRAVIATSLANLSIVPDVSGIMLENAHSVKCLSSDGRDDHDAEQFGCTEGNANQTWQWGGHLGGAGEYAQLVNQGTHQCLGISAGSTSKGATVVVWKCLGTGHPDQYWDTSPSGGPAVNINNLKSSYCLQIAGDSTASGARANVEPFDTDSSNQDWNIGTFP